MLHHVGRSVVLNNACDVINSIIIDTLICMIDNLSIYHQQLELMYKTIYKPKKYILIDTLYVHV